MSRSRGSRTWILCGLLILVGYGFVLGLDQPVYRVTAGWEIESIGIGALCRVWGYYPSWLFVAVAMLLIDRRRLAGQPVHRVVARAQLLFLSPLVAGIAGELAKLLFRRERPSMHDGAWVFRDFSDRFFYGGGLALPSSDCAVAFAGAFVLTRLYPAAMPLWLLGAVACGLARLQTGAHFLSDAYVGALIGVLSGWIVWRLSLRSIRDHATVLRH